MAIKDSLLPEYDHELATTRRVLERVPEAAFSWKPHDKSMSMAKLAGHVASIPYYLTATLAAPFYDFATPDPNRGDGDPDSAASLMRDFDHKVTAARAALANASDAELMAPWSLKNEGHVIFTLPRVAAIRSFVMNHLIHHRGQLSVYLRLNNVPVPSIYGPSADEQ